MLTVELTQISKRKWQVKIGNWNSGPGILKTVNRRSIAHLKEIISAEKRDAELERYAKSPKKKCPRCKGKGYLDAYLHVAHGVCYKCGGSGKVEKMETKTTLCLKEDSKGNWQPLFSEGFI